MYEKVSDSVYFIHGQGMDSNSILVVSDIVFLVDTGTGQNIEQLKKDIDEIGHQPEVILNTHCHFDHVGGNHFFNRFFLRRSIWI